MRQPGMFAPQGLQFVGISCSRRIDQLTLHIRRAIKRGL
jgi:hypothetical protein